MKMQYCMCKGHNYHDKRNAKLCIAANGIILTTIISDGSKMRHSLDLRIHPDVRFPKLQHTIKTDVRTQKLKQFLRQILN